MFWEIISSEMLAIGNGSNGATFRSEICFPQNCVQEIIFSAKLLHIFFFEYASPGCMKYAGPAGQVQCKIRMSGVALKVLIQSNVQHIDL